MDRLERIVRSRAQFNRMQKNCHEYSIADLSEAIRLATPEQLAALDPYDLADAVCVKVVDRTYPLR